MSKELEIGINKLKVLDIKQKKFENEADAIQKVAPLCQLPICFQERIDEAIKISEKKANIWNNIRGFLVGNDTLWQLAIKQGLPVRMWGKETSLKFYIKDLKLV